jgi:hypothetical protein
MQYFGYLHSQVAVRLAEFFNLFLFVTFSHPRASNDMKAQMPGTNLLKEIKT